VDPCVQVCNELGATFGPVAIQVAATILGFALVWWRAKRKIDAVGVRADVATEQASKAKAELREAKLSLARIEGSLRPAAIPADLLPMIIPSPPPPARESEPGEEGPADGTR
jgi:hypothetical protein